MGGSGYNNGREGYSVYLARDDGVTSLVRERDKRGAEKVVEINREK